MNRIDISVIIPVYNAERFINKAIASVLNQPEVSEVILIDDGSQDNSLNICRKFEKKENRVTVLTHQNNTNKGPANTRNLGITYAKNKFIAFLDADDYYLDNRFKKSSAILLNSPEIDGVYEAISPRFYDGLDQNDFFYKENDLYIVSKSFDPKQLFFNISPIGRHGRFSANGLLIKKKKLIEAGLFDNELRIGEDILMWLKLAIIANLQRGEYKKPIAIYHRHSKSTTFLQEKELKSYLTSVYDKLLNFKHKKNTLKHKNVVVDRLFYALINDTDTKETPIILLFKIVFKFPYFMLSIFFLKNIKYCLKNLFK